MTVDACDAIAAVEDVAGGFYAISTGCGHGRQPICEHTPQPSPLFAQISPGEN